MGVPRGGNAHFKESVYSRLVGEAALDDQARRLGLAVSDESIGKAIVNDDKFKGMTGSYTSGSHTVFHHRYHIVWITKYRYKVLEGALRERIRTIIRQLCKELGVQIVSGVLSREHVHMFVEIPPHIAVSDFVRRVKGRSSHQVQMEFPDLRKRYWGRHFWARGYFSTTSGNITDDVILQYLQKHEPTGASR